MNPPPPPLWTGPVILTLCIAALALVTSGVALTWQIVSWRRSGPRVRVATTNGIGGSVEPVWFIGVEASNGGRIGTRIGAFGFQLRNGMTIQAGEDFLGQPITPVDLQPGSTEAARYSVRGLAQALADSGDSGARARPFVITGHGKVLGSPTHLGDRIRSIAEGA